MNRKGYYLNNIFKINYTGKYIDKNLPKTDNSNFFFKKMFEQNFIFYLNLLEFFFLIEFLCIF